MANRWTNAPDGWTWRGWVASREWDGPLSHGHSRWVLDAPSGARTYHGRLRDAKAAAVAADEARAVLLSMVGEHCPPETD